MAFATVADYRVSYEARFNRNENNDSKSGDGTIAYRHGGRALVVYFDGHVGEMSQGEIKTIDSDRGKINPFWQPTAKRLKMSILNHANP